MSNDSFNKEEERILRLLKPTHNGFLRVVFSRVALIAVLIGIQIAVLVMLYFKFEEYVANINVVMIVFSILMVIYLYNSGMDSSSKLTWMMLIGLFPVPGALFLGFTRLDAGSRSMKRRVIELSERTRDMLEQDPAVIKALEEDGGQIQSLHHFVNLTGSFPVYTNTAIKYFPDGQAFLESVIEDIEKAQKYIFMEYFIISEGYMWGRVLDILARKAAEGVDVRVMYDGMCELKLLPPDYPERMGKLGIKCREFAKIYPFLSTYYNYRDHRKILVVDGRCAYTGGINFADEYINHQPRFGHWKDTAIRLEGDAVRSFALMFLQMWNIVYQDPSFEQIEGFESVKVEGASGYVLPFSDSPLDRVQVGEGMFIDTLNRASKYVHIITPYLIVDDTMKNALRFAAGRGVDVKLILPGIPDKKAAFAIAKSHYPDLIEAGVKIYEYSPGFPHAKVMTSDDTKAMVGSINLDYRSLYHHFECAAYIYKNDVINDIEADFQYTLKKCRKVTPETIKHEKISYKIFGKLLKFVAPLM